MAKKVDLSGPKAQERTGQTGAVKIPNKKQESSTENPNPDRYQGQTRSVSFPTPAGAEKVFAMQKAKKMTPKEAELILAVREYLSSIPEERILLLIKDSHYSNKRFAKDLEKAKIRGVSTIDFLTSNFSMARYAIYLGSWLPTFGDHDMPKRLVPLSKEEKNRLTETRDRLQEMAEAIKPMDPQKNPHQKLNIDLSEFAMRMDEKHIPYLYAAFANLLETSPKSKTFVGGERDRQQQQFNSLAKREVLERILTFVLNEPTHAPRLIRALLERGLSDEAIEIRELFSVAISPNSLNPKPVQLTNLSNLPRTISPREETSSHSVKPLHPNSPFLKFLRDKLSVFVGPNLYYTYERLLSHLEQSVGLEPSVTAMDMRIKIRRIVTRVGERPTEITRLCSALDSEEAEWIKEIASEIRGGFEPIVPLSGQTSQMRNRSTSLNRTTLSKPVDGDTRVYSPAHPEGTLERMDTAAAVAAARDVHLSIQKKAKNSEITGKTGEQNREKQKSSETPIRRK